MPHDKNGNLIIVGDILYIPVEVTRLQTGEEFCNAEVKTVEKMFPGEHYSNFTINTKQARKAEEFAEFLDLVAAKQEIDVLTAELAEIKLAQLANKQAVVTDKKE